jgi:ligand-binding sensor domain-containing protein
VISINVILVKKIVVIFFFILTSINGNSEYNFKQYSTNEGLPHEYCLALTQDSKGFIWVGTVGGLSRFDGKEFLTYTTKHGLPSNMIQAISEDKQGNLWVGTQNGVAFFDGNSFISYHVGVNPQENNVYQIYIDSKNSVWLCTNGGLYRFNYDTRKIEATELRIPTRTAIEDEQNRLWFGTQGGIYELKTDSFFYHHDVLQTRATQSVVSSERDNQGGLWFGSVSGITHFDGQDFHFYQQGSGSEYAFRSICISKDNRYLFGTFGGGVKKMTDGEFVLYKPRETINGNTISAILEAHDGSVWLASGEGLINMYSPSFLPFTKQAISASSITSVGDTLFISSSNGLYSYTQEQKLNIVWAHEEEQHNTLIFVENIEEILYFGSFGGLVFKYENGTTKPVLDEFWVTNNATHTVFKDSHSNLWIGKQHNIAVIDANNEVNEFLLDSIHHSTFHITQDSKENIWFSTSSSLSYYDGSQVTNFYHADGVPIEYCLKVIEDENGIYWIISKGMGLLRFDGEKFMQLTIEEGLNSNFIHSALKLGNTLWLGTANGINELILNEESMPAAIKSYGKDSGLSELYANEKAICYHPDFGILIGMRDNIYQYNPKATNKTVQPIVRLLNTQLFFEDTIFDVGARFPYDKNHLSFEFRAIDFQNPTDIRYRWRLLGQSDDWSPLTTSEKLIFTSLPPNRYLLEVKAINSYGVESEIFQFPFDINPPFWKRPWFLLLSTVLVLMFIFFVLRFREKRMLERKNHEIKLKEFKLQALKAQINPHFLFNVLASIQDVILNKNAIEASDQLSLFGGLIRKTLNFSELDEIGLQDEIDYLKQFIEVGSLRLSEDLSYVIDVDSSINTGLIKIPPMLIQPHVENALEHGLLHKEGEKILKLKFEIRGSYLVVTIEDNGLGFSKDIIGENSKGIRLVKDKLTILNKTRLDGHVMKIEQSNDLGGVKITLTIPIPE